MREPELLTVAEAARRLGTDRASVLMSAWTGELPYVKLQGEDDGGLRIPADAVPPAAVDA